MPVGWCTIEQLVPEDGPAAGQRVAAARRCEKPGDRRNGPGPSHSPACTAAVIR